MPFGATDLRLTVSESDRIVKAARRRYRRHNAARRFVETEVFAALAATSRDETTGEARARRLRRTTTSPRRARADVAGAHAGRAAPRPVRLARRSCASPPARWLTEDEWIALRRERLADRGEVMWTDADVALLDEARELLGPRPAKRAGADGRRDPHLRPHRGRRGAGPLADAAAHGRPPVAQRLDDDRRRHRPGHRAVRAATTGTRCSPTSRTARPPRVVELTHRLPHPGQIMALANRCCALPRPRSRPPVVVREGDTARRSCASQPAPSGRPWSSRRQVDPSASSATPASPSSCPPRWSSSWSAPRLTDAGHRARPGHAARARRGRHGRAGARW